MKELLTLRLKETLKKLGYPVDQVVVERQVKKQFGDYSSSVALTIASQLKQTPEETAKIIEVNFPKIPHLKKIEVKAAFVNFYLSEKYFYQKLKDLLKENKFVYRDIGKGGIARVEYISANPTGPLHIGNARGGPIGESIARVLEKLGFKVLREYIHNDIGTQVVRLGESIWYWVALSLGKKETFPEEGYKGEYVADLAKETLKEFGRALLKNKEEAIQKLSKFAVERIHQETLKIARDLGIRFDLVVSESSFVHSGKTKEALDFLKDEGFLKEQNGAIWFAPRDEFLKDRECVVVRSDGRPTYFANDISYHRLKFKSRPALVIDIFGSNHHGHVPRLKAAISALGYDASKFNVVLYQQVRVKKGSEVINMSKRAGNFVTAQEVLEEVGGDAFNFFMLLNSPNTHIDFDLKLAKEQSAKNPVFYVQYAHARCASILNKAGQLDYSSNFKLLVKSEELDLLKKIIFLPEVLEEVINGFEVQALTHYCSAIAESFHKFYETCPVINAKPDVRSARLDLVKATKMALKETLQLVNVSAPDRM